MVDPDLAFARQNRTPACHSFPSKSPCVLQGVLLTVTAESYNPGLGSFSFPLLSAPQKDQNPILGLVAYLVLNPTVENYIYPSSGNGEADEEVIRTSAAF